MERADAVPGAPARLQRFVAAINAAAAHAGHAALWLLAAVVLYDVALRTAGHPPVWGAEVSVYLMIALAFLGAGHTWHEGGHFRVTILTGMLEPGARRFLDAVCAATALAFAIAFTAGAWRLAAFSYSLGFTTPTVLRVPMWLLQGLIVLGGAFLALALVEDLVRLARGVPAEEPRPMDAIE